VPVKAKVVKVEEKEQTASGKQFIFDQKHAKNMKKSDEKIIKINKRPSKSA